MCVDGVESIHLDDWRQLLLSGGADTHLAAALSACQLLPASATTGG